MDSSPSHQGFGPPNWTHFDRSPNRASIPVSSVSALSTSTSRPIAYIDYIERCFPKDDVPNVRVPYNLNDITQSPTPYVTHTEAEKALCNYIQTVIRPHAHVDVKVKHDKALVFSPYVCTIPTSEVKRPDCSIVEHGATIFICELESSSKWNSTCLKLTIHLAQMLASLRNRCNPLIPPIYTISGFYFPFASKQCVVQVEVKWSDKKFKFEETHSCVEMNDIGRRLVSIYIQNERHWRSTKWDSTMKVFNYPVTHGYLTTALGIDASQLQSGDSVVIVASSVVYKKPMCGAEASRLYQLLAQRRYDPLICYPHSTFTLIGVELFVFRRCRPPPDISLIRQNRVLYAQSLVTLVNTLHESGLAHLDLRRDNVCVSDDNKSLVLIDLDRSQKIGIGAHVFEHIYVNVKYKVHTSWTNEQVDWLQVGIMLKKIFPEHRNDAFILKLINEGEI